MATLLNVLHIKFISPPKYGLRPVYVARYETGEWQNRELFLVFLILLVKTFVLR